MAESTLQTQLISSEQPQLISEQAARECILLFTFELPDPEIQLYIQLGKDLDTFTLFPRLPLELRLKIWRRAFPKPRLVHIGPSCSVCYCWSHDYLKAKVQHIPLLVTLRINSESRTETLKFYTVIWRDEKDNLRQPLYFDHTRDKLYMGYCHDSDDQQLLDWVKQLKSNALGRLEKVNNLEFDGVWFQDRFFKAQLMGRVSGFHNKHLAACRGEMAHCICSSFRCTPLLESVMQFSGLRRLDFWLRGRDRWEDIVDDKGESGVLEEYRVLLANYFEIQKEKFDGGKVPQVRVFYTFEPYGRRKVSGRAVKSVD
jgi:hypothetical protein